MDILEIISIQIKFTSKSSGGGLIRASLDRQMHQVHNNPLLPDTE